MAVSTYRGDVTLPTEVSAEILQKTQEQSAIMRLAKQIALPGAGIEIPVVTSDPTAEWVGETDEKTVSNPGLSNKTMTAYKLAVIVPFSNEFRRDLAPLYDALVERLPLALAKQFDATVVGAVNAPGSNFDTFAACTPQSIATGVEYAGLVAANTAIAAAGGDLNGFALSPQGKGALLAAVDGDQRPLFLNSAADGAIPQILGAPVTISKGMYKAGTPNVVGVAGDWTQALYGTVEGVKIDISDQATLTSGNTTINLFQQNMFAVRAEIELGFRADTACFNLLTA